MMSYEKRKGDNARRVSLMAPATALATLLLTASCDVVTSDNGDLDGYWQLSRIDTLQSGGTTDMTRSRLFWSVQTDLLKVSDLTYQHDACLLRFDCHDDSLILYSPYLFDQLAGDTPLTDPAALYPYGIRSLNERYCIEQLDGSRMRLHSAALRLYFNRY